MGKSGNLGQEAFKPHDLLGLETWRDGQGRPHRMQVKAAEVTTPQGPESLTPVPWRPWGQGSPSRCENRGPTLRPQTVRPKGARWGAQHSGSSGSL